MGMGGEVKTLMKNKEKKHHSRYKLCCYELVLDFDVWINLRLKLNYFFPNPLFHILRHGSLLLSLLYY